MGSLKTVIKYELMQEIKNSLQTVAKRPMQRQIKVFRAVQNLSELILFSKE